MGKAFCELKIWQKGYELLRETYNITSKFPKEEKYNLTSELRTSFNSVIANIAEAHGRYYYADRTRISYTSRGEAEETRTHLRVAYGLKYIKEETFTSLDKESEGLSKGVSVYIRALKKEN